MADFGGKYSLVFCLMLHDDNSHHEMNFRDAKTFFEVIICFECAKIQIETIEKQLFGKAHENSTMKLGHTCAKIQMILEIRSR